MAYNPPDTSSLPPPPLHLQPPVAPSGTRHSRSKSYSYRPQMSAAVAPPPSIPAMPQFPPSSSSSAMDYNPRYVATANEPPQTPTVSAPIFRRHSKKKSSQILVEPIGQHQHQQINYMPMSPTVAVPQGLEKILLQPPPPSVGGYGPGGASFSAPPQLPGMRYIHGAYDDAQAASLYDPALSSMHRHTSLKINPSSGSTSSSLSSLSSVSSSSVSVPTTPLHYYAPASPVVAPGAAPPAQLPPAHADPAPPAFLKQAPVSPSQQQQQQPSGFRRAQGHSRTVSLGDFDRHTRYAPASQIPPVPPLPAMPPYQAAPVPASAPPQAVPVPIPGNNGSASPVNQFHHHHSQQHRHGDLHLELSSNTLPGATPITSLPTAGFGKKRSGSNTSTRSVSPSVVSAASSPASVHSCLAGSPVSDAPPPLSSPYAKPTQTASRVSSSSSSSVASLQQGPAESEKEAHPKPATSAATQSTSAPQGHDDPANNNGSSNAFSANALASGASFLIAGQFFSKLVTFSLNQLILRFVGPEVFGANSQLELLISTVLFFSREAIRLATQRQSLAGKRPDVYRFEGGVVDNTISGTVQEVINIGFIPVLLGIPLASILSFIFLHYNHYSTASPEDYKTTTIAIVLFAISSIIELASEPAFLLFQLKLQFKKRASFESIAITCRCVLTFLISLLDHRRHAASSLIAFAVGQLAYSCVLTGLYIFEGLNEARSGQYELTYPRPIWKDAVSTEKKNSQGSSEIGTPTAKDARPASLSAVVSQETSTYFNPSTMHLATSIWLQTVFKHCLTEGDRFLVSLFLPITDQGVYAIVVNYGSLIARLVFFPIEEALRNFFSKLLSSPQNSASRGADSTAETSAANMELSVLVMSTLLRFYAYLSLFALAFGPVVAAYILQVLVSKAWYAQTDAAVVLATYACYIPFLAINGALEAFVQSVASPDDIKHQSSVMLVFSVSFSAAAYLLMRPLGLGAQGLVLANMFNMAQRIGWCLMWVEAYYKRVRANSEDVARVAAQVKLKALQIDETEKEEKVSEKKASAGLDEKKANEKKKEEAEEEDAESEEEEEEDAEDDDAGAATATGSDAQPSTLRQRKTEDKPQTPKEKQDDKKTAAAASSSSAAKSKEELAARAAAKVQARLRALSYAPWGWLRLATPSPLVLAAVVLAAVPTSWLLVGRAVYFKQFVQQVAVALGLLAVIAVAERDLVLQAGRSVWTKILHQRRRRRAANDASFD